MHNIPSKLVKKTVQMFRLFIISIIISMKLSGQTDSILSTDSTFFKDGLYVTYFDFRHNFNLPKDLIKTNIDKDAIDFYTKITSTQVINYLSSGNSYTLEPKKIWGYVQNQTLFLNFNGVFYRVPIFGAISYFAGIVEVTGYYNGVYDPMFGSGMGRTVKTQELKEFTMNYYTGIVKGFDMEEIDLLLSKDDEVYKQFKSLSRRKRSKQASRFIRMYNERHPVYYLK